MKKRFDKIKIGSYIWIATLRKVVYTTFFNYNLKSLSFWVVLVSLMTTLPWCCNLQSGGSLLLNSNVMQHQGITAIYANDSTINCQRAQAKFVQEIKDFFQDHEANEIIKDLNLLVSEVRESETYKETKGNYFNDLFYSVDRIQELISRLESLNYKSQIINLKNMAV